jgi:nucleoside-diphosphate-sugar epimerase
MKISILGLGWLGEALAFSLKRDGHQVWGSYRTNASSFPDSFPLVLPLSSDPRFPPDYLHSDVLIATLAPSSNAINLAQLYSDFFTNTPQWKRVLITTSTSIYGEHQGEVDESSPPAPDGSRGMHQLQVEQTLETLKLPISFLRLGGLMGPDRHPIKTLAGKSGLTPGPLNCIDQHDVIRVIKFLLHEASLPQKINCVAWPHQRKEVYYPRLAHKLGLRPVEYTKGGGSSKVVHSTFLKSRGFTLENPELDWRP